MITWDKTGKVPGKARAAASMTRVYAQQAFIWIEVIVNVRRLLRKGVTEKLHGCMAFATGIVADEIICTGGTSIKRYQVETCDRLGVAVTLVAQEESASTGNIKGDKITR